MGADLPLEIISKQGFIKIIPPPVPPPREKNQAVGAVGEENQVGRKGREERGQGWNWKVKGRQRQRRE